MTQVSSNQPSATIWQRAEQLSQELMKVMCAIAKMLYNEQNNQWNSAA
jgi:hypothetical protein